MSSSFASCMAPWTSTSRFASLCIMLLAFVPPAPPRFMTSNSYVFTSSLASGDISSHNVSFLSATQVPILRLNSTAQRDLMSSGHSPSAMTTVKYVAYLSGSDSLILPICASASLRAALSEPRTTYSCPTINLTSSNCYPSIWIFVVKEKGMLF